MTRRLLSVFLVGALVGLTSCSEGYSSADVKEPFAASVLVFDGVATGMADQWSADFAIANAPAGEYFLFVSTTRPTSAAGVAAFDPSTCGATCHVDGLGDYSARSSLNDVGNIALKGYGLTQTNTEQFFVIARRAPAALAPVTVTGTIGLSDNSGCETPTSPTITSSEL